MLVSEWATKYWEISTVTKKTLYDYKSVFGRVIEPHIGHYCQREIEARTPHNSGLWDCRYKENPRLVSGLLK